MNNVVVFQGSQVSTDVLSKRLQKFKQTRPRVSDGSIFIKMGKDGTWTYGAEEELLEDGSRWAINPHSMQQGYICWPRNDDDRGGGPLDEIMFDAGADVPDIRSMPANEGGVWSDQLSVVMQCISGEDAGLQVVYKVNSKSGVRELNALVDKIMDQAEKDPDKVVPVVELENDHYKHRTWGKIYTPVLHVVSWISMDGPADEPEEDTGSEDAPVRRRRRK